jgi:transposase
MIADQRHFEGARWRAVAISGQFGFVLPKHICCGRICLSNNAAERGVRGIALGRKSWLFCGSDRGGERAAVMYSLLVTAKMNDIDPQAWLADVLARIADHPVQRLDELRPWNWHPSSAQASQAA